MEREYYSIPEAAALIGISRIAVFKRVKKGSIKAIRIGRNWAVPAAEIGRAGSAAAAGRPAAPPAARPPAADDGGNEMDSMGWD